MKEKPQPVDAGAVEGVEELLWHLLVGPVAARQAGGVLAPASRPAVRKRDVESRLALGLDHQARGGAQPPDEVGGRVAMRAGLGDVVGGETAGQRGIVAGGVHRQDSVRAGLAHVSSSAEYVAGHDAARPMITPEQIERVFDLCREHGGAALAEPISDTVKRATEEGFVCESIERDQLYAMQTPQIFSRSRLERGYAAIMAEKMSITDEVTALEHLGDKVVLVPNEEYNFKITYPADLPLAAFIIGQRQSSAGAASQ